MVFLSVAFLSQSIYHSSQHIVKGFCKKEVWQDFKEWTAVRAASIARVLKSDWLERTEVSTHGSTNSKSGSQDSHNRRRVV